MSTQPLTRTTPAPPVRLVHVGLGAFHRAHQIFYTQQAEADPTHPQWGYCSFTGRSPRMAELLSTQEGLYTLVTRASDIDTYTVMTPLVEAQPADNLPRFIQLLADPQVAVVTLTVTEAGYHLNADGALDHDDQVTADIAALTAPEPPTQLTTAAGKIVAGLRARRAAGGTGIAVMSCDNIATNGDTTRASVLGLAQEVDAELAEWIAAQVSFPSTSIDRITPRTEDELLKQVAADTGFTDVAPVVTEPFASWIIAGEFPAGRPDWETAGVQFVTNIDAFERRKLWMLNGAHSLLAYFGQLRGHDTVASAIGDPEVRRRVDDFWRVAAKYFTVPELEIIEYQAALLERFANPRIAHYLKQIAIDGGTKQRMRTVPIIKQERAAGADAHRVAFSLAAWIAYLLGVDEIADTRAAELDMARHSADPVVALVAALDVGLSQDAALMEFIRDQVTQLQGE